MNKLIERLVKVPLSTRIAVVVAVLALVTGGNWYFFITALEDEIVANQANIDRLNKDLVDKKVIADNLNEYRHDKEVLERRLAEALTELPASKDIDELLRQLNDVGKKSGLEIVSIEPGSETPAGFYASIPIKMSVSGNFHEIAVFFESISKLRRIVNVSGLTFNTPTRKNEKVVLQANYLATTFRFLDTNTPSK
ncbi:MAG: type 4a pilus biogenesis protein PilO [Myxococcales bacterium]